MLLLTFALIQTTIAADVYAVRHRYVDAACTDAVGYDELYYWGECLPTRVLNKGTVKYKGADDNGIVQCLYDAPADGNTEGCTGGETCVVIPFNTCVPHDPTSTAIDYYMWRKLDSVSNGYTRMAYNGGFDRDTGESRSCSGIRIKPVDGKMPAVLSPPRSTWRLIPIREYFVTSDTSGTTTPNVTTCVDPPDCPSGVLAQCPAAFYGSQPTGTDTIVTCSMFSCSSTPCDGGRYPFSAFNLDNGATCQTGIHAGTTPRPVDSSGFSSRFSRVLPNPDTRGASSSGSAVKPWMVVTWVALLFIVPKR